MTEDDPLDRIVRAAQRRAALREREPERSAADAESMLHAAVESAVLEIEAQQIEASTDDIGGLAAILIDRAELDRLYRIETLARALLRRRPEHSKEQAAAVRREILARLRWALGI